MSAGDDNCDSCGEAMFGSVDVKASANEFNFPGVGGGRTVSWDLWEWMCPSQPAL